MLNILSSSLMYLFETKCTYECILKFSKTTDYNLLSVFDINYMRPPFYFT